MHTPRDNTPGVDTGRGTTGGGKGAGVSRKGGKPTGPARPKDTLTHSTPLQSQGGASDRATDNKVGIIKHFEFNVPCNMQDLSSSLEEQEIRPNKSNLLENNFYLDSNMDYSVQELSQTQSGLTKIVQNFSYIKDCTIFGESHFESNEPFTFNEPISTSCNTNSFEQSEEPISVNSVFSDSIDLINYNYNENSFVKEKKNLPPTVRVSGGEEETGGERTGPPGERRKEEEIEKKKLPSFTVRVRGGDEETGGERSGPPGERKKEEENEDQRGKRKGNEDEKENKEGKKMRISRIPREAKKTFAEATKGTAVLEVRSSTGSDYLKQQDWSKIGFDLIKMFAKLSPRPAYQYGVKKIGCSQGGIWISVVGQPTVDFVMHSVPEIQSPIGCFYTYKIYGPDEKPFKYYKARIPEGLWCEKGEELVTIIKTLNWELDLMVEKEEDDEDDEDMDKGEKEKGADKKDVPVHLRISSGMKNKQKEIKGGHFLITMEMDERLTPILVGMNGILNFGHIKVEVYAGGLDKAIKYKDGMVEENRIEEQERRLAELGAFQGEDETQEEEVEEVGDTVNDVDG